MTLRLRLPFFLEAVLTGSSALLMAAGVAGIGTYVWSQAESWLYQRVQNAHFDAALDEPAERPEQVRVEAIPVAGSAPRRRLEWFQPDPLALGRLEVPRLGVRAIIREGIDASTLRKSVGHVTGTPLPGSRGNSVIAGHRDTFFRALRDVEKGELIRLRLRDRVVDYAVESMAIVSPDAVEVMAPTPDTRLTLITCFPFDYVGPSPRRMVIGAVAAAQ